VSTKLNETHLLMLFELACSEDLHDSSRWESFYPALRALCEDLVAAGLGGHQTDSAGMTVTTPSEFLAYLDREAR